jgi:hypothetical protein
MQLCVMKRTILGRILSFDRILSDILLVKLTLLEVKVVKHYFLKITSSFLGQKGTFGHFWIFWPF